MSVDHRLLDILCCPVSHQALRPLSRRQLEWLNDAIRAGGVLDVEGRSCSTSLDDALLRQDGQVLYPVIDDIPVLLADQAIGTTQFQGFPG